MAVVTKEQRKTGLPRLPWSDLSVCVQGGSCGPWRGCQHHGHKTKLSTTGNAKHRVCVVGGGWGTHIKIAFMNLCFSTNKWNGLGTLIPGEPLQANQKLNKL